MTWYPPCPHPTPRDYHDVSPPILDWVSGKYTPPRPGPGNLETVAKRIAKQFAAKVRTAKTARTK